MEAVLQVGSHKSGAQEGRITSLDLLATLLLMQPRIRLAFWDARAHCWLIHQYAQVLLCRAALCPFIPQSLLILGIAPPHVQDLMLGLVELHEVLMGSLLKPVQTYTCPDPRRPQSRALCKLLHGIQPGLVKGCVLVGVSRQEGYGRLGHQGLSWGPCQGDFSPPLGHSDDSGDPRDTCGRICQADSCGGLTLAGCHVPTKLLCHSPSSARQGERKCDERLMG